MKSSKKNMEGPWLSIKRPKELWPAGCDLSTDAKYLCLGIPGGSQNQLEQWHQDLPSGYD